jgi:dehydrogenase/reductase SDR family protein 12
MSIYRSAVWFTKGMMEYTKPGYETAAKKFNPADLEVDLSQKSIMITGANSGIGKVAALEVAKRGAVVHMICRSKERGEAAQKEIIDESKNTNVNLHIVDMSQPRQVYKFAKNFASTQISLNILVNNAGCMINERESVEGLEANFATNTLGTHILTKVLLPLIAKSVQPRVIIVSSGGMLVQPLKTSDFNNEKMSKFDGTMVYAQNKRQQVVMAESYARNNSGIYFATMHPGWSDTPAVQTSMPSFREKMINKLRSPEQGADTIVWLCCFKDLEKLENGAFFQDRVTVAKHLPLAWTKNSPEEENVLMTELDNLLKKFST